MMMMLLMMLLDLVLEPQPLVLIQLIPLLINVKKFRMILMILGYLSQEKL